MSILDHKAKEVRGQGDDHFPISEELGRLTEDQQLRDEAEAACQEECEAEMEQYFPPYQG